MAKIRQSAQREIDRQRDDAVRAARQGNTGLANMLIGRALARENRETDRAE